MPKARTWKRYEIYVQGFPNAGGKLRISTAGRTTPRRRRDGQELFYATLDGEMMSAALNLNVNGPNVKAGKPLTLFTWNINASLGLGSYDVSSDGRRFLMLRNDEGPAEPLTVILNWKLPSVTH